MFLGGTNVNSMNLTSLSSAGELLSLQPAAVYVQPSNQNGQVQFYKVLLIFILVYVNDK